MPDNKSEPTEMQKNLTQAEEEKIVEGLNTPLDDCIPESEVEW